MGIGGSSTRLAVMGSPATILRETGGSLGLGAMDPGGVSDGMTALTCLCQLGAAPTLETMVRRGSSYGFKRRDSTQLLIP